MSRLEKELVGGYSQALCNGVTIKLNFYGQYSKQKKNDQGDQDSQKQEIYEHRTNYYNPLLQHGKHKKEREKKCKNA